MKVCIICTASLWPLMQSSSLPLTPGGGVLPYKGLMGTCGQPGYVFLDFCLKQGIEFIIFCLNQGRKISDICLKQGQGMRGCAAPPHPGIYRVLPPRPFNPVRMDLCTFVYFVSKWDELLTSLTSINTGTINNSLITLHLDGLTNSILLNGNENRILSKWKAEMLNNFHALALNWLTPLSVS